MLTVGFTPEERALLDELAQRENVTLSKALARARSSTSRTQKTESRNDEVRSVKPNPSDSVAGDKLAPLTTEDVARLSSLVEDRASRDPGGRPRCVEGAERVSRVKASRRRERNASPNSRS
jgi:hypothetical protein